MTVESFDPKQTTTLESPSKAIKELSESSTSAKAPSEMKKSPRIGFVSLGCLR